MQAVYYLFCCQTWYTFVVDVDDLMCLFIYGNVLTHDCLQRLVSYAFFSI
jgi:hypothetical protein